MQAPLRSQTRKEELINAATHGAGLLLALIAIPFLIIKAGEKGNAKLIISVSSFAFGVVAVYLCSTLYHLISNPGIKRKANIADHISIFFLIGGTYTPVVFIYTSPKLSFVFLIVQWSIIAVGATLKLFFTGKYNKLSLILYITLGWMLVFIIQTLLQNMPADIFYLIVGGGIFYSAGTIFFRLDKKLYAHNIWHCFVLAGTLFHFIAIYKSL